MGTGYVRQSSADIVNGNDITAGPLNNEFNAIKDAFDGATGHSHDGTVGEGPQIDLTIGVTGSLPIFNGGTGASTKELAKSNLEIREVPVYTGNDTDYLHGDEGWKDFAGSVRASLLTGYTGAVNAVVAATDTVLQAIQKLQGQINSTNSTVGNKANTDSPTFTGTPTAPTPTAGNSSTRLATTSFVATAIAAIVQSAAATLVQIWGVATGNLFVSAETINTSQTFVSQSSGQVDLNLGINFKRTLTSNHVYTLINIFNKGGRSGTIRIQQDATGSRTVSFNTIYDFGPAGPPTLSTAPNAVDYVFYQIDDGGTRAICSFRKGT